MQAAGDLTDGSRQANASSCTEEDQSQSVVEVFGREIQRQYSDQLPSDGDACGSDGSKSVRVLDALRGVFRAVKGNYETKQLK